MPPARSSVALKELWQHLPEKQAQQIVDRLSIILHRQLADSEEGEGNE